MSDKRFDVFLSCKSEDYKKAEEVYHWLVEQGHNPFFAPVSLKVSQIHGEAVVFGDEIDDALEQADNMVVFTSNADYVKVGYVKDEWRTFVEEQRAGRKSGSLVTILDGVGIDSLPIRLRSVQSFTPNDFRVGLKRFIGDSRLSDSPEREKEDEGSKIAKEDSLSSVREYVVDGVSFKMIYIEGGRFMMGSQSALAQEMPIHEVRLSSFYMGQTSVTQELWEAVMGNNNSNWKGLLLPVENISWKDCQSFIKKLNQMTNLEFRLPTEAEWEFAARGGNKSKGFKFSGSDNINEVAWCGSNSNSITHEVATKKANELGLFDMSGNVWEWCQDKYSKNYYEESPINNPQGPKSGSNRVLRGGGLSSSESSCRVAYRNDTSPTYSSYDMGFRLVLDNNL